MRRTLPKTIAEENREEIYRFIVGYISKHCYPPSFEEIAEAIGISGATVRRHVQKMLEDRILETDKPGEPRAYRIAGTKVVKKGRRK